MKITILTYGSRGDVQPFLPLSVRLMESGHVVKVAAPSRFKSLIEEYKIEFVPLAGDPQELSRRMNDAGHNFVKLMHELTNHAIEIGADVWRQTVEAGRDADLIIHTFAHAIGAHTLAREMGIPDIHIQGFPMFTPTGDYPNVTFPDWRWRGLNRLTHTLSAKIMWAVARFGFEQVRRRARLPKQKLYWPFGDDPVRPRTPILCAWSPGVIPASKDWPSRVHVTGYYFFRSDLSYQPPARLLSFLQEGDAPVCVTFGSMVNRDRGHIDRLIRESLRQTGNRGVILSGWSGIREALSRDVCYLEEVSHDWLLPHCKAVIHHGGAGTTAAGLRAGIPNIVVPFMADQPFWGRRVYSIGAGPKPILVKNLTVENLTKSIANAEDELIRKQANAISQQLLGEDGTGEAVRWIETYSNNFHR